MKKQEFNILLKKIVINTGIDLNKIKDLTTQERSRMIYHIVKNRCAIVKDLIPENFDMGWLHSMGYLYETKGKLYTFIHTCEQRIK